MPTTVDPPERSLPLRVRRVLRELGPAAPLFVATAAGPLLGVVVLAATQSTWLPLFDGGAAAAVAFCLCGAVAAAVCLLPTHATSLVAGFVFGGVLGGALAWLVVMLAALLGFALFGRLVGRRVLDALQTAPRALTVHRALFGRGPWRTAWLIALLRLSPVMPFAATNLLMAALGVRVLPFACGTLLGVTPRVLVAAWLGGELSALDLRAEGGPEGGVTTGLAIAATLLAVVVVGRVARRALRREAGA